jgi:hypothetical protein
MIAASEVAILRLFECRRRRLNSCSNNEQGYQPANLINEGLVNEDM